MTQNHTENKTLGDLSATSIADLTQANRVNATSVLDANAQRVMQSPIYLLLSGDPRVQMLLRSGNLPLPVLAAVSEWRWLNLLGAGILEGLLAGELKLPNVLAKFPQWQLSEQQYEALREPEVRQLINNKVFSLDRFAHLNGRQINALCQSHSLRAQLLSHKTTVPTFLRYSPSQLDELLASVAVPPSAL
jgi:hypothetical protein